LASNQSRSNWTARGGYAAAACSREQPVSNLDRVAGGVQLARRRAAQELAGLTVDDRVRDELAAGTPQRQLFGEHRVQLLFAERR
jgi:hypothetical protein